MFTSAVTLQGGLYSGWITNSQDIAPNFAGTILGITNACGAVPGFVANQIAGAFINENPQDVNLWRPVWIITCSILVASSIFFSIFAQGDAQPWNNVEESTKGLVTEKEVHEYGSVAFLSNYDETQTFQVTYRGMQYYFPNHTVCIIDTKTASVVWNSSAVWGRLPHRTELQQVPEGTTSAAWSAFFESPGFGAETQTADVPLEMLALTNDNTDYIWYSVTVETAETKSANPVVHAAGSNGAITYIYVNGVPQRADTEWQTQNSTVKLDILACAMGISNGDVGPHSTKGLNLPVAVNGATISNTGQYKWTHSWVLQGERDQIFTTTGAAKVVWKQVTSEDEANATAVWFRGSFDMPKIDHQATQTSYALDLSTMNKGVAYVNGFNLGRYWLTPGKCTGACAPPVKSGHCYMHWKGCDKPTQTLYHVPTELLKPTANLVVLFEETSNSVQQRSLSGVRLRALHDHPA